MKILKIIMIIVPLLFAAGLFAEHFKSDQDAYSFGFRSGYNHGVADSSARVPFDFHHTDSHAATINYYSYNDDDFKSGYEDGYQDGYYRQQRAQESEYDGNNPDGFRVGFREGYHHGLADRNTGLDLNYRHAHSPGSG